ncbi:MAG: hypothetical protein Fur0018_17310 [Anaerolineales bacterium]
MPFYRDTDHLYTLLRALFEELQSHPGNPVDDLTRSRLTIHLQTSLPAGEILIDGRVRPATVYFGNLPKLRPVLKIELQGDTLHRILLDELSLKEALARKQIIVHGPVWKTMSLAEIFSQGRKLYPRIVGQ